MRAAFIGPDGVLRDADGRRISRVRRPTNNGAAKRRSADISRPLHLAAIPNIPEDEGQTPTPETSEKTEKTETLVSPARKLAGQVGVPTSGLSYSYKFGDPGRQIYPGRIVFQKEDPLSLYVVSARIQEEGWVYLFKLEGVGRGRWFEVPLERTADETGKVRPGLLTDFMVVPYRWTPLVWSYVSSVAPIFENEKFADPERLTPEFLEAAFTSAMSALRLIPSNPADITVGTIRTEVVDSAGIALVAVMMIADLAGAAYDALMIGRNALALYRKVGHDLIKGVSALFDIALEASNKPSRMAELSRKIVELRNELLSAEELYRAYMGRAQLYTQWKILFQLTTLEDLLFETRNAMDEFVALVDKNREQILAKGMPANALDSLRSLCVLTVRRYDRTNAAFKRFLYEVLGDEADTSGLYFLNTLFPAIMKEDAQDIKRLLKKDGGATAVSDARLSDVLAQVPPPEREPVDPAIAEIRRVVGNKIARIYATVKPDTKAYDLASRTFYEPVRRLRERLLKTWKKRIDRFKEQYMSAEDIRKKVEGLRTTAQQLQREGKKDEAERMLKEADELEKQIKSEPGRPEKRPVLIEKFNKLTDRIREAERTGTLEERIEAELKTITDPYYARFIKFTVRAFLPLAKSMFPYRDVITPGTWRPIVRELFGRAPMSFMEAIEKVKAERLKIAQELGLSEHKLDALETMEQRIIESKLIPEKVIPEKEYKDTFPNAKVSTPEEIRGLVENAAALRYLRDQLVEMNQGQALESLGKSTLQVVEKAQLMLDANERSPQSPVGLSLDDWQKLRSMYDVIKATFPTDKDGKLSEPKTGLGARIWEMLQKDSDLNKALRSTEKGREQERMIDEKREEIAKTVRRTDEVIGPTYDAFQDRLSKHPESTKQSLKVAMQMVTDYMNFVKWFEKEIEPAVVFRARWRVKTFKLGVDAFKYLFSYQEGMFGKASKVVKEHSGVGGGVLSVFLIVPMLAQTLVKVAPLALLFPSSVGKFLGLIKAGMNGLTGLLGGDPDQSQYPPGSKPPKPLLSVFSFILGFVMIVYGKPFFEAVGKSIGGFFQFATALLPSSAKRGRGKGGLPGAPGAPGRRRGPRVDVDKWLDTLDANRRRLEQAKSESAKQAAQREIDKAIEKLKQAKEEGQPVPEGLWGFNWLY